MGIIDIALLVGLGFLIARIVEKGKDKSRDYAPRDRHIPDYTPPTSLPVGPIERSETEEINFRTGSGSPPVQPFMTPKQARDKKMAELKRRYVADEITVEEYERELDRLMKENNES